MHKDIRKIARQLEAQGWTIRWDHVHPMACPPDKTIPCVPLPTTPSGGRWRQNLIAQLRRHGANL